MIIKNGFIFLPITDKAKEVFATGLFEVYTLHDDGSESLCQSYADINDAIEWGLDLAIEVGHLNSNKISVDICFYKDGMGNNIYDFKQMEREFKQKCTALEYSEVK